MEPKTASMVMGAFFLTLAVLCLLAFFRAKRTGMRALDWPIAEAIITKSERADWVTSQGLTRYDTDIAYAYNVRGERYECSRITLADRDLTIAAAKTKAMRYPLGSKHNVRYDPDEPSEALLEVAPAGNGLLYLAGLFIIGVAFTTFLASLHP